MEKDEKQKNLFQHKNKIYKVIKPTPKIIETAEEEENKVFSKLFRQLGILTRKEMEDELEKRGLWTKEERDKLNKIRREIDDSITELAKATDKKKERKIYQKIKRLREKENELTSKYDEYFGRTVEARAENARLMSLISSCVLYEDGTPVWKSVSDFQAETDMELVSKATSKFLSVSMGVEVDSFELLEDQILKRKEGEAKEKERKNDNNERKEEIAKK